MSPIESAPAIWKSEAAIEEDALPPRACRECEGTGAIDTVCDALACSACGGSGRRPGPAGDRRFSGFRFVNVYLIDRAYGGPEEGGWWYDFGESLKSRPARSEDEAQRIAARWKRFLDRYNEGRPQISSMASQGRYAVSVEDEPGADFPQSRPRFE